MLQILIFYKRHMHGSSSNDMIFLCDTYIFYYTHTVVFLAIKCVIIILCAIKAVGFMSSTEN